MTDWPTRIAQALLRSMATVLLLGPALDCRADSPLTSTVFHPHYKDVRVVANARFDAELLGFLLGSAPLDQKAAAINALGAKFEGRDHAARLLTEIARRKGRPVEQLQLQDLSAEQAFVLGYLRAMDDYLTLTAIAPAAADVRRQRPADLLTYAETLLPEVFTVAIIAALVRAQENLGCETFRAVDRAARRFPTARRDMRTRAVQEINSYIDIYLQDCKTDLGKSDPGFNQFYALAHLGRRIAAGTQAGLLLWDPETGASEAHALGICAHLTVWRGAVMADCDKGLYRHDGKVLTKVWASGSKESSAPKVGPDNALYVFDQDRLRRLDKPGGSLSDGRKLQAGYHDAAWAADGSLWGIVFLQGIVNEAPGGPQFYARKSPEYPGSNPRTFHTGPDGALWVVDFESGFFRFDPDRRRFVAVQNAPDSGSKMHIDAKRHRTWLLGYSKSLVLLAPPAPARRISLPEGYFWDLLPAEDGSVWLASLGGLYHLKLTDGSALLTKPNLGPRK